MKVRRVGRSVTTQKVWLTLAVIVDHTPDPFRLLQKEGTSLFTT